MEKAILWIKLLLFEVWSWKRLSDGFISAFLSSPDVNWWTGVVWIIVFIRLSFWRHAFTAEHPMPRHWCRNTFLQIWWRNKLIYISDGLRVSTFSANFHFWVNYCWRVLCQWFPYDSTHTKLPITRSGKGKRREMSSSRTYSRHWRILHSPFALYSGTLQPSWCLTRHP